MQEANKLPIAEYIQKTLPQKPKLLKWAKEASWLLLFREFHWISCNISSSSLFIESTTSYTQKLRGGNRWLADNKHGKRLS